RCSNGIIHVVDSVLLPPAPEEESSSILAVAKSAGKFNTLLAAIEAAGLTGALSGDGPLTVFAPTDAAFKALPAGTVETLLKTENRDQLKGILAYHAVAGKVSAGDALNAKAADSLQGSKLVFAIKDGVLKVNGATVKKTDIVCDNGVIHVIDAVLLPGGEKGDKDETAKTGVEPGALIEKAIERGVPIFNDGNHAKCAEIYRACLEEISSNKSVEAKTRKRVKEVLQAASQVEEKRDRAWLYRHALDLAYSSVSG
ncbi:MAG: fasciclin domain-containing protein, partial [Verrucomicrobiales bacterium]